jgi:ATP-dependent exoDNAse (exonuclease V) beta subunit
VSYPVGATVGADGVNFCVYSRDATGITVALFDHADDATPVRSIRLDPDTNRTYHYWHVFVPGLHAGQLVNVIIDRLLIERDGTRWVVDYKTSRHEGGDLQAFLASEEQRHGPQLQRYAALVRAVEPGEVRAALYFPLLGEFREVPLAREGPLACEGPLANEGPLA